MNNEARHIIKSYEAELQRLTREIAAMGELAAAQLETGMTALVTRDGALAEAVINRDDVLDEKETEVSHDVLRLLALRQPAARDLREVLAALRIASDIERIGDYGVNIARRSLSLDRPVPQPLVDGIVALAALAGELVRGVMRAWQGRDTALAHATWRRDDEIDAVYVKLFRDILAHMQREPRDIPACTHLLFVVKNLERTGDHVTNIAENIWFATEGDGPGTD